MRVKKSTGLAIIAVLLAVFLFYEIRHTDQSGIRWIEFSSQEGRFTILMPGKPTPGAVNLPLSDGSTATLHAFTALDPKIKAICGYWDFAVPPSNVNQVFDNTRDGSIRNAHGKLLEQQDVSLKGYPGRQFKMSVPNAFITEKMYLVNRRTYLLTVVSRVERDPNVDKLINSFQLAENLK